MSTHPAGTTCYRCPVPGCGWHHDELPGLEGVGPLRLPLDFAPDDMGSALSEMVGQVAVEKARQVETALRAHLEHSHPGVMEHLSGRTVSTDQTRCANCGVPIVPTEDGYTHVPDGWIAECVGGASPTPTPWWEIKPKDPSLAQCETCAALVLKTGLARHEQWHADHARGEIS